MKIQKAFLNRPFLRAAFSKPLVDRARRDKTKETKTIITRMELKSKVRPVSIRDLFEEVHKTKPTAIVKFKVNIDGEN